jgi:hypothetical protein
LEVTPLKVTTTIEQNPRTANPAGDPKIIDATPRTDYNRDDEKTPFENFEGLATKLLRVPKEEAEEQARKRKQD